MNNRDDVPGYGYQLKKGATTLTESWPALKDVSNNHLMLGHIMEWFYSGLAGISQEDSSVAFKHIKIRPQPVGDITYTKGSFHTPYGWVTSAWQKTGSSFVLKVHIPVNTTATIYLPAGKGNVYVNGVMQTAGTLPTRDNKVLLQEAAGDYTFEIR
ncbi:MAG TPA: alpha-L-rhamnosidase C-terminal domain-containing protein [Chitinophagaceae bacterium]|nr:alpha-L-rhamnosidase C-terminal domain-containing protein [Chitinophagaceae bacterium]